MSDRETDRISRVVRDPVRLEDVPSWIRVMSQENERYVRAGAGKHPKLGLCWAVDDGVLCPNNVVCAQSLWCKDHRSMEGTFEVPYPPPPGVISRKRKLSLAQAEEMRELRLADPGYWTHRRLSREFGIGSGNVSHILAGETYQSELE